MSEQAVAWLLNQGPTIVILVAVLWAMAVKGVLVPGAVYRREAERADRLEALLLRSVKATERAADVAEKTVGRTGGE